MRHHTRRRHLQHSRRTRYRLRHRQYGKGAEEAWIEPITAAIQRLFPDYQYAVKYFSEDDESSISASIYCPSKNVNGQNKQSMITFTINDNELFINGLMRCPDTANRKAIRGTDIVKQIIMLGNELKPIGIKYIRLYDGSSIDYPMLRPNEWCSISLAYYKILTSRVHHSWYNSYGFKSDDYEEEVKNNVAFAEQPMMTLLRMVSAYIDYRKKSPLGYLSVLSKKSKNKYRTSEWEKYENAAETDLLVKTLLELTDGAVTPDMPVQHAIEAIHPIALQAHSCKDKIVTFYKNLMDAAGYYGIQYNRKLTYTL